MKSAVMIIPASHVDAANAFGDAMDWGYGNFSVALSSDGETVTHYGCRADVGDEFLAILQSPPDEAKDILPVLIIDIGDKEGHTHWLEVLEAEGLRVYGERT